MFPIINVLSIKIIIYIFDTIKMSLSKAAPEFDSFLSNFIYHELVKPEVMVVDNNIYGADHFSDTSSTGTDAVSMHSIGSLDSTTSSQSRPGVIVANPDYTQN